MTDKNRLKTFVDGFFDSFQTLPNGERGVHTDALTKLVHSDPDTAAFVIRGFCEQGEDDPAYFEYSLVLAGAYAATERDRSPYEHVREAIEQTGQAPRFPTLRADEPAGSVELTIEVTVPMLQACDIGPLTRSFSLRDSPVQAPEQIRKYWGSLILTFKLDDDPREVWLIPESRRYVQTLHAAIPYFPALLNLNFSYRQMPLYFGCLAPLEAMSHDGYAMNATDDTVVAAARIALTAIGQVATQLALDPTPACGTVLALYGEEARELFPEWADV